jgi:ribosomal protein L14E/L6E/L27E
VVYLTNLDFIGRLAYSLSGRDKDKLFIILGIINKDYVFISDGELRPTEKPKKKKIKHLKMTSNTAEDIKSIILAGDKVSNSTVKKFIQLMNSKEEV